MSQSQCGRSPSQAGYPSSPWWAITPTNKLIGRESIQNRNKAFHPHGMRQEVVSGIRPGFPGLSRSQGQVTHVLLTRSPLIILCKHRSHRSTCMC